ncbi:MAG: cytochrome c peroxidase [Pirellulaceae bacterium]
MNRTRPKASSTSPTRVAGCLLTIWLLVFHPGVPYAQERFLRELPVGLDWIILPEDNPVTPEKVDLGHKLFFDARLSRDNSVRCATCHDPAQGWANDKAFSVGVEGRQTTRNTPSIVNAGLHRSWFWDGRAKSLEEQALDPIENRDEMDMTLPELVERLEAIPGYRQLFSQAFEDGITPANIGKALAAFQRTIVAGETPYDQMRHGNANALTPQMTRGATVFFKTANCFNCHITKFLHDHSFHNLGVDWDKDLPGFGHPDPGRYNLTGREEDRGKFRTPMLRDLDRTAPYMHDGSLKTLEEVVEFYNKGGNPNPYQDHRLRPLNLTAQEKADLVHFLKEGLRSKDYPEIGEPELP